MNKQNESFYYWVTTTLPDEQKHTELYFDKQTAVAAFYTALSTIGCPLCVVFSWQNLPENEFDAGLIASVGWKGIATELRATKV